MGSSRPPKSTRSPFYFISLSLSFALRRRTRVFHGPEKCAHASATKEQKVKNEKKRNSRATGARRGDFKMSDNLYRPFRQPPPSAVKTFDVVILAELIISLPRSGSFYFLFLQREN